MTEKEKEDLRGKLQETIAKVSDRRTKSNYSASIIAAYLAIAAVTGSIVLWMGDARIDQGTRKLSDEQISMKLEIKQNKEANVRVESKIDRMVQGVDELKVLIIRSIK